MKIALKLSAALLGAGLFVLSTACAAVPGGKTNFSVCVGAMNTTTYTVVRLGNFTFDANGTLAATWWSWDSRYETGKTLLNVHTCTQDGVTKTCNVYTPTGWMAPAGYWFSRSGNYTYNATTGALAISWINEWAGVTENWTVSAVGTPLARLDFVSSNYGLTHGRGWGSNASWSTFKTVTQVPRISYPGGYVLIQNDGSTTTLVPATGWHTETLNLSAYTSSANGNALHVWDQSSTACGVGGGNPRPGIVYHLGSNNNGRSMAYNHWCASLPFESEWPCYVRAMHPFAFQQIIDDTGALRGFVGIEQQNESGSVGYRYQLKAYLQ
jgi:hypothetical protein